MNDQVHPYKDPKKVDSYSCEITINGSKYYLTPLQAGESPTLSFVRGFRLEKLDQKRPGVYDVVQTSSGMECDCQDFQQRRKGVDTLGCKHLRAMYYFGFLSRESDPVLHFTMPRRRLDFPDE
jgi:hypothetical protein